MHKLEGLNNLPSLVRNTYVIIHLGSNSHRYTIQDLFISCGLRPANGYSHRCLHLIQIQKQGPEKTMGRSSGDEIILSYNDAVLRRSDLDILSGPYYLNDRIIEFYFSYLSSTCPSEDILLVPPSIAFWLQNCPDEESLKAFIEPLNLSTKKLIMFPVNDNEDVTLAEGGSHWSLLVSYREANVFVHHDSCRVLNSSYAKRLFRSVALFVGSPNSETRYEEHESSPQQQNGYDCGLFGIAIARVICNWYTSGESVDRDALWFSVVKEQVTPSAVSKMRGEILDLIRGLMAGK